jgi:hypothetical protein
MSKYIELYSKNRNRILYPNPSTFTVSYSPTSRNVENPVINGTIYYKFSYQPGDDPTIGVFSGFASANSDLANIYLIATPSTNIGRIQPYYPTLPNFFVGYIFKFLGGGDTRVITSYEPTTGRLTFDKPWIDAQVFGFYKIYLEFPTFNYISIPTVDINGNVGLNYEGAYNGYYVIFESKYKAYSNPDNSNIFYRQISYYDNTKRIGYFDKPIPFDYRDQFGFEELGQQFITLRKTLPLERWTLNKTTYYNKTPPLNPIIGPLVGPVITLPEGASSIDNYYKGKYVYNYGKGAYYGEIDIKLLSLEIPEQFYPIYGFYFIKAYNGQTRELSVEQDINNITCNQILPNIDLPGLPSKVSLYNSSSLIGYISASVVNIGGGVYRANISTPTPSYTIFALTLNPPGFGPSSTRYWEIGSVYTIRWRVRKSSNARSINFYAISGTLPSDTGNIFITNDYTLIELNNLVFTGNYIDFYLYYSYPIQINDAYIEWDYLEIVQETTINITDFDHDSYSPLDYIGTTVSLNDTVCYEVSLESLTLPNLLLKTGSKISFYPFVYVELSNATSPNTASNELIYSNNPNSNKAIFVVPVGLRVNPNTGTFLTLYSDMKQYIKFKPNDNLVFSVYLPDGSPFNTFIEDTFPPYEPDSRIQIEVVFEITRKLSLL